MISESSLETERVLREEFRVKEAEMSEREERREAECAGLEKKVGTDTTMFLNTRESHS